MNVRLKERVGEESKPQIFLNGYIREVLPVLREMHPDLAERVELTKVGEAHLFDEEDLLKFREVCLEHAREDGRTLMDSNLPSGYAQARWSNEDSGGGISAYMTQEGQRYPYQENIAAMFWYRFGGNNEEERDLERLNFYMNMGLEEAVEYANQNLVRKGESFEIK